MNIAALQSFPMGKDKSTVHLVIDNPTTTKTVLDVAHATHTEMQVAQTNPHHPGALAGAATILGEANININYAYAGIDPDSDMPVVLFGVAEVSQAAKLLDEAAKKAA